LINLDAVASAARDKRLAAGPLAAWLLRSLLDERPMLVDPANAARTQLVDRTTLAWAPELLEIFGLAPDFLPRIVPNRHPYGHLSIGERSIPLVVCTGDQSAMPFARGWADDQTIYLNIGTGAFMQRLTSEATETAGLLNSVVWLDERDGVRLARYATEGTVNGAGSALDWLNERVEGVQRAAAAITRELVAKPPLFINAVSGIGSPFWRSHAESHFIGGGDERQRVVAVVESIAFLIATNIERMREGAARIVASGGLSANDYLCDCIASLTRLPVERSSMQEATATGLAYLVADRPHVWKPATQIDVFKPTADVPLADRYARWQQAMS
jgi:glycerol kinase